MSSASLNAEHQSEELVIVNQDFGFERSFIFCEKLNKNYIVQIMRNQTLVVKMGRVLPFFVGMICVRLHLDILFVEYQSA